MTDEYCVQASKLLEMYDLHFEPYIKSLKNAIPKYNKTRDPASAASMQLMRQVIPSVHPLLKSSIDNKEEALIAFKNELSTFKPKQSVLEIKIAKTNDQEKITNFRSILDQ